MDWTVLDLEHGEATEADLLALLYAVGTTPMAAIVRPQSAERLRVGRALDLGAPGSCSRSCSRSSRCGRRSRSCAIRQSGVRGVALRTRGAGLGSLAHADVARVVNELIVGIVQIESVGAVAAADEIAALDEVDVLFVGPADLSHSLGAPRAVRRPDVPRGPRHGHGSHETARQGGRDPPLRRRRLRAAP